MDSPFALIVGTRNIVIMSIDTAPIPIIPADVVLELILNTNYMKWHYLKNLI